MLRLDEAGLGAFDAKTDAQLLRPEQLARKLDETEARLHQVELELAELRRKDREPRER